LINKENEGEANRVEEKEETGCQDSLWKLVVKYFEVLVV